MSGTPLNTMPSVLKLARTDHILRFVQQHMPASGGATVKQVLSDKTKLFVPGVFRPTLDAFMAAYSGDAEFRIPLHFSYVSTGTYEEEAETMSGAIRRFREHARMDIASSVLESDNVALKKFRNCDFVPTYRDLFLAGAAIASIALHDGVDGWEELQVYKAVIEQANGWITKRMMPLRIDMRPSLFFVSGRDRGAGPVMEVGRKRTVSREDRDFSLGDEVHALLNTVRPEAGSWYHIPPLPFTVYPGTSGWHVNYAFSQVIEGGLAQLLACEDRYGISKKKLTSVVKMNTSISPDAEGVFQSPVCGRRGDTPLLEHVFVSGSHYAAVNIQVAGSVAFVLPIEGSMTVRAIVNDGSKSNHTSYDMEPGGGAILFSPQMGEQKQVKFSVRALERAGFLVFRPWMLRSASAAWLGVSTSPGS